MKKLSTIAALTITVLVGLVSMPASVYSEDMVYYGALAYEHGSGRYGVGVNYETRSEASRVARERCGGSNCYVVVEFHNTCAAYALSDNDRYIGWATDPDKATAERAAIRECEDQGGSFCTTRVWGCTYGRE